MEIDYRLLFSSSFAGLGYVVGSFLFQTSIYPVHFVLGCILVTIGSYLFSKLYSRSGLGSSSAN